MEEDERDLVTIATCGESTEASLIKGFLESEGVFCYVQGEEHRQMLGVLGAYVEPKVMVKRGDVERAVELVELFRGSLTDEELAAQSGFEEELEFDDSEVDDDGPYRSPARLKPPDRRRKPIFSMGIGLIFGFGQGHRTAGAGKRSLVLATAEIAAFVVTIWGTVAPEVGAVIIGLLHLCDATGGALVAHGQNKALPPHSKE